MRAGSPSLLLKLYESAVRSKSKTDTAPAAASAEDADSVDRQADDEPHTEPADEEGEAPDNESGSAAEKASISSDKGEGLTKCKLKGLKGSKKRGVLSMSSKSPDVDEATSYACKARTEMVHRILEGLRDEAFGAGHRSRVPDRARRATILRGENAGGCIPPCNGRSRGRSALQTVRGTHVVIRFQTMTMVEAIPHSGH